jgi:hypothetical protein
MWYWRVLTCINVILTCINMNWCDIDAFSHALTCIDVFPSVLTCINMYWHDIDVFSHVFTCLDVYWHDINVCWCVLMCTGVVLKSHNSVLTHYLHILTCIDVSVMWTEMCSSCVDRGINQSILHAQRQQGVGKLICTEIAVSRLTHDLGSLTCYMCRALQLQRYVNPAWVQIVG